jgi:MFS family permease
MADTPQGVPPEPGDEQEGAPRSRSPFRALGYPAFRAFWVGQFISLIGTWMQGIALRWLVWELTGSQSLMGIVGALQQVPAAALAPFSGVFADRHEKRKILVCVQILSGIQATLLWMLVAAKRVRVWHVAALGLGLGLVNAFDMPTRQAFWADLVARDDLMSAITLNSTIVNLGRILGPGIAGVLIEGVGIANCFLINALSYIAPLIALIWMPATRVNPKSDQRMFASLKEGLRYVRGQRAMIILLLLLAAWGLFGGQYVVLMPALADRVFGLKAKGFGYLSAAVGVGAVIGAVMTASLESRQRRGQMVLLGAGLAVLGLTGAATARTFGPALLWMAVLGFGAVMQMATANTLIQTLAPNEMRGRVMGVYALMFLGFAPPGSLFYGFLGDALGPQGAMKVGLCCFAAAAALLLLADPSVRRLK